MCCVAITFRMTERGELQTCIQFCVRVERSSMGTARGTQEAFGDDALSAAQIQVWPRPFGDGREPVGSDPHSGRPTTSRTPEDAERVRAAADADGWLTARELEADLGSKNRCV